MDENLGEKRIRGTGEEVLRDRSFYAPDGVLASAILSGHRLAYRRSGRLPEYGGSGFQEPAGDFDEERFEAQERDEESLIPCMTAIICEHLQRTLGGRLGPYKRTEPAEGAE